MLAISQIDFRLLLRAWIECEVGLQWERYGDKCGVSGQWRKITYTQCVCWWILSISLQLGSPSDNCVLFRPEPAPFPPAFHSMACHMEMCNVICPATYHPLHLPRPHKTASFPRASAILFGCCSLATVAVASSALMTCCSDVGSCHAPSPQAAPTAHTAGNGQKKWRDWMKGRKAGVTKG